MGLERALFSPIGKEYCRYFYFTSVFAFIFFFGALVGGLYQVFTGSLSVFSFIMGVLSPGLLYFSNRLLYSMCIANMK